MTWSHAHWPAEQHELLIELVKREHGGALPEWAICADLVYRADRANHPKRPVPMPGRRALQQAWGVGDWTARKCLADPAWREKCKAAGIPIPDVSDRKPTRGSPADQPAALPRGNGEKPATGTEPTRGPPADQPAALLTRVVDQPSDLPTDPPPLPPASGGHVRPDPKSRWVATQAEHALAEDLDAGIDLAPVLERWAASDAAHVERWLALAKPRKAGKGRKLPALLPGAPSGLRERDVAEGLRLAALAWHADGRPLHRPRPPEPEPDPPPEDPPPEPEPEPVALPPPRREEPPDHGQSERARRRVEEAKQRVQRREAS